MTCTIRIADSKDRRNPLVLAGASLQFTGGLLNGCVVNDVRIYSESIPGEGLMVRSPTFSGLQETGPLGRAIVQQYEDGESTRVVSLAGVVQEEPRDQRQRDREDDEDAAFEQARELQVFGR